MDQGDYFRILRAAVDLGGKDVLEVGGCVPPSLISSGNVRSWTSIDITERRFEVSLGRETSPKWHRAVIMDAAKMTFRDESFNIVYSANSFEHISELRAALGHIYRVLRPFGMLFTIFSPIWSGPVGHHTWVWDGDRPLTFSDGVFPDWYHLVKTEQELGELLVTKYRPELVNSILRYVYRSDDINRLVDSDYDKEIQMYAYTPIIKYRIRSRQPPNGDLLKQLREKHPRVQDFTTLGYVWVLSKGPATLGTRARVWMRGGTEVLWRKLYSRFRPSESNPTRLTPS